MIVAGIDVGGKNVHIVVYKDGQIIGKGSAPTGIKKTETVEHLYDQVLERVGLSRKEVERIGATGISAKRIAFASRYLSDIAADGLGAVKLFPNARTVIDVGAEEARAIRINSEGKVFDFAINDRCAAGTGMFVEAMARALEVSIEELSKIALNSTRSIPMNAQCVVFGESEVISLIHQLTPKADIARAVMDAIAGRMGSLARVVGLEKEVILIGGMAKNGGFVDSLKKNLEMEVIIPHDPDYVGAIGAAEAALIDLFEQ